ncbi:outer membrane beta-barrel domain-containing protein [Bdellovibrio sp. 22V]|uniref:outer membrane beta-barrel domain-containing protein n=1 Tax=Bdellovibrio TaxID=958 RepID=UPI0025428734|nr:outer membrane beta-barrel domain-containing protein [Bdellovibrio sp. 22V]WII73457.1 outer membrane beta-barrel domain-containing protein [Bdellovibrio sp. 22V]
MLKNGFKAVMIIVLALLLHKAAFAAEVVELPPEELAQESVLPVFDKAVSVKNRNIVTAKRWDVDVFYGYAMTEPIANVSKFGLGLYYNFDESHALGLMYSYNLAGLSDYAKQIEQTPATKLDFTKAPMPKSTLMADYNIKAFYGKMSLSKSLVFNTILYGSASLGAIQYDHKTYPAIAGGLGQKFYFNKNWALRFDLRLFINQGPVPFLGGNKMQVGTPAPDFSEFEERVMFTTNLDVGLSYLF